MADRPSDSDLGEPSSDDTGVGPKHGGTSGLARWQRVVGIIGLLVVLLVVVLMLRSGGHGPSRHGPAQSQEQPVETAA